MVGYPWRLDLEAETALFPTQAKFAAQVRAKGGGANTVLATLTSANGGIARLSDTKLRLSIPPEKTSTMLEGFVVMDVARTDLTPKEYMNFILEVPVATPITRSNEL